MAAIKYIKRTVALDGSSISEPLPASFFNSESSAHTFIIAGQRDGAAVAFTGAVSAIFHNPNDADVSLTGSVVDGAAVVTLSNACYALSGRFTLTIDVNGATVYECQSRIKRRSSGIAYDPNDELTVAALSAEIAAMRTATAAANTAAAAAEAAAETVGADVEKLQERVDAMLSSENFSYAGAEISHYGMSNTGKWTYSSAQESYTFEIGSGIKTITVTGGTNGSIIAFLNTYSPTAGNSVDFATGYSQRIVLAANETKSFVVSGDMHYFFALLKDTSENDKTPAVVLSYVNTDTTLTQPHVPADGKAAGDAIDKLCTNIIHDFSIDAEAPWVIINSNVWTLLSDNPSRSKMFCIPKNAVRITVTAGAYNAIVACLRTAVPVASATPDYSTGWGRTTITAGNSITFDVGSDCNYLYCTTTSSQGNDVTPTVAISAVRSENSMLYPIDMETESESGKHDRADEIMSMLNTFGVCQLAPGIYYTGKSIDMPDGTMIQGSGANTIIKPFSSVAAISTITMEARCTVKNLTLKGADSGQKTLEPGNRNGIEWTGGAHVHGAVENCKIVNFSGAGIYLHDTTANTNRNLAISDCYIAGNSIGIDIYQNSEFNRIVNCTIYSNGIGYRNRGGNNNISNCGIDSNIQGIEIDNDYGGNGGHGTITGCSINHSDSNNGYGLIIRGTGRMIVANCNFYYSKLKLQNTNGNVFTGCGFGSQAPWEIIGVDAEERGGCNIFNGCMVRSWADGNTLVTITDNTATKIVNCFDRAGNAYSA